MERVYNEDGEEVIHFDTAYNSSVNSSPDHHNFETEDREITRNGCVGPTGQDPDRWYNETVDKVKNKRVKKTNHPKLLLKRPSFFKNKPKYEIEDPKVEEEKDIFGMESSCRGFCLIIANSQFDDELLQPMLSGYEQDSKLLKTVFEDLHFKVQVFKNKTRNEMESILKEYSTKMPTTVVKDVEVEVEPSAFVGIILSHGDKEGILGRDSSSTSHHDKLTEADLVHIFNNQNSILLQGRPKLFFIQVCLGEGHDRGVSVSPPKNPTDQPLINSVSSRNKSKTPVNNKNKRVKTSASFPISANGCWADELPSSNNMFPIVSEMMICYATILGYQAWVGEKGSVFCACLAEALIEHAYDQDLQSLINLVSHDMRIGSFIVGTGAGNSYDRRKQIPEVKYKGWTRKLYFNPGYPKLPKTVKDKPKQTRRSGRLKKIRRDKMLSVKPNNSHNLRTRRPEPEVASTVNPPETPKEPLPPVHSSPKPKILKEVRKKMSFYKKIHEQRNEDPSQQRITAFWSSMTG